MLISDGKTCSGRYNELELLQSAQEFDQLIGQAIRYVSNDESNIEMENRDFSDHENTAICKHIMRAGKHFAAFATSDGKYVLICVIRPIRG